MDAIKICIFVNLHEHRYSLPKMRLHIRKPFYSVFLFIFKSFPIFVFYILNQNFVTVRDYILWMTVFCYPISDDNFICGKSSFGMIIQGCQFTRTVGCNDNYWESYWVNCLINANANKLIELPLKHLVRSGTWRIVLPRMRSFNECFPFQCLHTNYAVICVQV